MSTILNAIKQAKQAKPVVEEPKPVVEETKVDFQITTPNFDQLSILELRTYISDAGSTFKSRSKVDLISKAQEIYSESTELIPLVNTDIDVEFRADYAPNFNFFSIEKLTEYLDNYCCYYQSLDRDYLLKTCKDVYNSKFTYNVIDPSSVVEEPNIDDSQVKSVEIPDNGDDDPGFNSTDYYFNGLTLTNKDIPISLVATIKSSFMNHGYSIKSIAMQSKVDLFKLRYMNQLDSLVINTGANKLFDYDFNDRAYHQIKKTTSVDHELIGMTKEAINYRLLNTTYTFMGKTTKLYDFSYIPSIKEVFFNGEPVGLILDTANKRKVVNVFCEDIKLKSCIKNHLLYDGVLPNGWQLVKQPTVTGFNFLVYSTTLGDLSYNTAKKLLHNYDPRIKRIVEGVYKTFNLAKVGYKAKPIAKLPSRIANQAMNLAKTWQTSQVDDHPYTIKTSILHDDCYNTLKLLGRLEDLKALKQSEIPLIDQNKSIFCRDARNWLSPQEWDIYIDSMVGQRLRYDLSVIEIVDKLTTMLVIYSGRK